MIHRLRKVGARLWQGLGQGLGKVWTKSKVRARSGQARSGQGLGTVEARFGQGLDKKQGSGKVGASSFDPNVCDPYHSPKSISGFYSSIT